MTDEAAEIHDTSGEEELEMCVLKTQQLLSEATSLLKDIEETLDGLANISPSRPRCRAVEGPADIQEDGDALVIEGFRFEDAASKEELKRLSSQAEMDKH